MDRFSKLCLCLIVLLLGVIAFRPLLTPETVRAAQAYQYAILDSRLSDLENDINKSAANGWEPIAVTFHSSGYVVMYRTAK